MGGQKDAGQLLNSVRRSSNWEFLDGLDDLMDEFQNEGGFSGQQNNAGPLDQYHHDPRDPDSIEFSSSPHQYGDTFHSGEKIIGELAEL